MNNRSLSDMRGVCVSVGFFVGIMAAQASYAFKIDTHVYIAQQVINDLADDGAVTIAIDGTNYKYAVNPGVVRAILANPAFFRMGAIGPDAFPDILGGQMAIHPGDESIVGWGTSEWLLHLTAAAVNDQEVSFARGFSVHAASDVFAHSYMNHYSGNVWLLTDGETDVERRHFILESFIASKNPLIRDASGHDLGLASATLRLPSGSLAIPDEFLARAYIFDGSAVRNFQSGAPHLPFLYHHEENLAHAEEQARNIAIDIERIMFQYWTGINLNRGQMAKLRGLLNDVNRAAFPVEDLQNISNQIAEIRKKFVKIPAAVTDKLLNELASAYGKFDAERKKFDSAALDAAGFADRLNSEINGCKQAQKLDEGRCEKEEKLLGPLGGLKKWLDPTCLDEVRKAHNAALEACERIQSALSLRNQLAKAIELRDALEKTVLSLKDDVQRISHEIENIMVTEIDLEHKLLNDALELVKMSQADMNVVVSFINGWRQGIRRAGMALTVANGTALINSITPGQDVFDPLMKWVQCYTPVVAGIPHPLADAACSIGDAKEEILGSLKKITATLAQVDPVAKLTLEMIDKFEEQIRQIIENVAVDVLQRVTGAPVRELLNVIREPGTVQAVTATYSSEQHNLRAIPDAAYRVGAEMHLTTDGHFDPDKFAVVYDAIVLSKLSLLGADQLNRLAADAGVSGPTLYGQTLFSADDPKGNNILFGAVRSIDGSHQWMERAMPYLRTSGHEHPELGRFSYLRDWDTRNGFRLWTDKNARDRAFRRIFKGPLVPGIDAPETIGFPPVLLANYPYQICAVRPFPDDNDRASPDVVFDRTCSARRTTGILKADPDATLEDADAMKSIHTKLAEKMIPVSLLSGANQWFCLSAEREDKVNRNFWTFKFYADGKFNARVSRGPIDKPIARQELSAITGVFSVVGDFLFATPKGKAFVAIGDPAKGVPTLVRRFTEHLQRYWIRPEEEGGLVLWNQDGTKLFCKANEWLPVQ